MSKVVLFFPNPFSATRIYPGVPLSVLGVSRMLHAEGCEVKIVAPNLFGNYIDEIVEQCKGAICLGISAMAGYQIRDGIDAAEAVRKKYTKLPVVWGGWHPSILPEETARDPRVDVVVKGQGERTFRDVVTAFDTGGSLDDIPNLTFERDGKIIHTEERPPESLDNFPPIPYELVDVEKCLYSSEMGLRTMGYYSSYGCPGRCGFCVEGIVNKRRWVSESADRIVDSMEKLASDYGVNGLSINDSNFFVNPKRVDRMCDLIEERGITMRWGSANGRPDQLARMDDKIWSKVSKAGCKTILIGAESGCQKALDFMFKDAKVEDTMAVAEKSRKHAIKVFFSFMTGLPRSEDAVTCRNMVDEEMVATIDLMGKLLKENPRLRIMFFVYLPYPSSTLFSKAEELGLQLPESLPEWSTYLMAAEDARNIVQRQQWISQAQMRKVLMISSYIFFFLDPDSVDFIRTRLRNPIVKLAGLVGFGLFKAVCRLRWSLKWFSAPLDFYFYYLLRKRLNIG